VKQNDEYSKDMKVIRSRVRKLMLKAKYKETLKFLKIWVKKYPNDLYILTLIALLPYEGAFGATGPVRDRAYKKAAANLKPLLKKLHGQKIEDRIVLRNEYYWFSQQHLKQYKLGVEGVKKGLKSYYSQGVGAANLAYKVLLNGPSARGLRWAKQAEKAWLNYFKVRGKTHYDPWMWYALAIGLQGRKTEMEKALKISAKLAGSSYLRDKSIVEIRNMVKRCEGHSV